MSDETELPPLGTDPDEWDDKWDESTTITVDRWVKAHLDHDRDGQPWNQYLERLRQNKADPLTLTEVDDIADHIETQLYDELDARLLEHKEMLEQHRKRLDGLLMKLTG